MKNLAQEKIIKTSSLPLTEMEKLKLTRRWNDQLFIAILIYLLLIIFCIFLWKANAKTMDLDSKSFRIHFSESETFSFQDSIPYISIVILLFATFFFCKFILDTIIPLTKDIKNGAKLLVYFRPEIPVEPINNTFFIGLPLIRKQQIELNKEEYLKFSEQEEWCITIAPNSFHLITLQIQNEEIKYFKPASSYLKIFIYST